MRKETTDQTKANISEFAKTRVQHHSLMTLKAAEANRGKKRIFSEEHKQNIANAARNRVGPKGDRNARWKGDGVGYTGIHLWMRREFGAANTCDECGGTKSQSFDWANLSGKYQRDRSDWKMLCRSCHVAYDHKKRMRTGVMIEFDGQIKNIKEWAEHFGIKYCTLYARLKTYNMPVAEAFLTLVSRDASLRKLSLSGNSQITPKEVP